MELGAVLLLIALLLSVSLYLAAPLMRDHSRRVPQETQKISSLMAERDRVINALQELDFDFKLGKIPQEDYPVQRAELLEMGTGILKKLDNLTSPASPNPGDGTAEDRLEEAAAARQADAPAKSNPDHGRRDRVDARSPPFSAQNKIRRILSTLWQAGFDF